MPRPERVHVSVDPYEGLVAGWSHLRDILDCVFDRFHQDHIIRVRVEPDVPSRYVPCWLSDEARSAIETVAFSSSGLHRLSLAEVKGLPVPLTTVAEMA